MHAFLCTPGYENALVREIDAAAPLGAPHHGARVAAVGVVTGPSLPLAETDFVHGRHILPDVTWLTGSSIRGLARTVIDAVWPALKAMMAWRLDVLVADAPEDPNQSGELARRAALLDEVIREEVAGRRKALFRVLADAPGAPRLQVLLIDRDRALVSLATPAALPNGDLWPSAWPAGLAPVAEDREAPSSAYRKLIEALAWLGTAPEPGQTVIDLGASPGGWSWVALQLGAEVVGVDKGAMDPKVLENTRFKYERRDAFTWEPPAPVDWLVCDVIAEPTRSAELLLRWARARWFRNGVIHLKVRGDPRPDLAREAEAAVRAAGYGYVRAKQLRHDKNEITVLVREAL